jgi:hypothetical protein
MWNVVGVNVILKLMHFYTKRILKITLNEYQHGQHDNVVGSEILRLFINDGTKLSIYAVFILSYHWSYISPLTFLLEN